MPYKYFVAGTEALASDINDYLMSQSVMVFADAGARNTALTSPTEGMITYQTASDHYTFYNGLDWIQFDTSWSSYTPTFTNFTLGNGTLSAQYFRVGKTVHLNVQVTLGSTSSVTGLITCSLPIAFASSTRFVGYARALAVINYIMHVIPSSSNMALYAVSTSGSYAATTNTSATVPNTWASGHQFLITSTYEIA